MITPKSSSPCYRLKSGNSDESWLAKLRTSSWNSAQALQQKGFYLMQVIKAVASHPGNCPAICRKYYVHLEQQIFKKAEQSIAS